MTGELFGGPAPGQIIATKYRIDRVLGVGGMGVVVAAHHLQLETKVAIKFLLPATLGNADAVARFAREARAAVKIVNDHVARVLDVGTLETGAPYIVMEFLEGTDLAARLSERGPLPIEEAVEFLLQACEALAVAHSLGIVHRDLKPANLFCIRRPDGLPWVKVLDFGISKVSSEGGFTGQAAFTQTSAVMGSPLYMSPEQMQSARSVDARSDIWALGIILYELLTGHPPFSGESLPELVLAIAGRPAPPLRPSRPDVPPRLEEAVMRCLQKDRDHRFRDVADLAVALQPFGPERARASVERVTRTAQRSSMSTTGRASDSGSPPPVPGAVSADPATTRSALGGTKPGQTEKRGFWTPVIAILGALVVGGGLLAGSFVFLSKWRLEHASSIAPALVASQTSSAAGTPAPASAPPPATTALPPAASTPPAEEAPSASHAPPPVPVASAKPPSLPAKPAVQSAPAAAPTHAGNTPPAVAQPPTPPPAASTDVDAFSRLKHK
jgi:serine/threonine-protein kinase